MSRSKQLVVAGALACLFGLLSAPGAKADGLKLACVPSSSCTFNGTTLVITSSSVTFDYYATGTQYTGDGFIGIVVPDGGSIPSLTGYTLEESASFTSGESFSTAMGESTDIDSGYNFSNLSSASNQVGVYPNSFTIYEFDLGTVTVGGSPTPLAVSNLMASNLSGGSIVLGWLETTKHGNPITFQTPLSESITIPEPGTPVLLGFGLLGLLCVGLIRKFPARTAA